MSKVFRLRLVHSDRVCGFTLIELLVAASIILILAAVAVVSYRTAVTRAKVSRVRNDLRIVELALESYRADFNEYPPHRGLGQEGFGEKEDVHVLSGHGENRAFGFRTIPLRLSTPVAFITTTSLLDPFKEGVTDLSGWKYSSGDPTDAAYIYHNIHQFAILQGSPGFFEDDFTQDYGHWRIFSLGPDRTYDTFGTPDWGWFYDPTNGTDSRGNIVRTQMDVEGQRLLVPDEE